MPKGATGYHMIRYKNLKMIDSCSFMQGSLSALVDLLMKKVDESSSECKMAKCLGWGVRCYKVFSKIPNGEMQDKFIRDLSDPSGWYPRDY